MEQVYAVSFEFKPVAFETFLTHLRADVRAWVERTLAVATEEHVQLQLPDAVPVSMVVSAGQVVEIEGPPFRPLIVLAVGAAKDVVTISRIGS